MNNFYFKGGKEELNAIITDPVIKKVIECKLRWNNFLLIQLKLTAKEEHKSYLMLKYGELSTEISYLIPDRTPVMFKDYQPKRLPKTEVLARRRINK